MGEPTWVCPENSPSGSCWGNAGRARDERREAIVTNIRELKANCMIGKVGDARAKGKPCFRRAQDKNLHVFGRAALLRRPRIQGRAAALPYQEGEEFCPAPPGESAGGKIMRLGVIWGA